MANRGSSKGERRGGRKKGTPNRVTADIKALCQQQGPAMVRRLAEIALSTEAPEAASVSAIKEILDRGYGKVTQPIGGDTESPLNVRFTFALDRPGS